MTPNPIPNREQQMVPKSHLDDANATITELLLSARSVAAMNSLLVSERDAAEAEVQRLTERAKAVVWQMNEAVSMCREAVQYLPAASALREEIEDGLPAMQSALVAAAALTEPEETK